jgi:putative tryptophan/tyrosine transport system substrate-binding protein
MPAPNRVGFLYSGSQQSLKGQFAAFKSLLPAGIHLIHHPVNNNYLQLLPEAQGLLNNVDVLVAAGGPVSAFAAKQATAAQPNPTPVVFTSVTEPVESGLYVLGGNLTGIAGMTTEMDAARLRLLQEFNPTITNIGVLRNGMRPNQQGQWTKLTQAADRKLQLNRGDVNAPGQLQQVVQNLVAANQALLVTADPLFNDQRAVVIAPGGHPLNIPAIYQWREFVDDGGLMSFGPNLVEEYSAAANYVVRILNGEPVANIPLYQPTTFELFINASTANALNLNIPPSLRTRAHVI